MSSVRLINGLRALRMIRTTYGSVSFHPITPSICSINHLHTTITVGKVRKGERNKKNPSTAIHSAVQTASENTFVDGALKEMNECEKILGDELAKHFSLKKTGNLNDSAAYAIRTSVKYSVTALPIEVDLRLYEDIIVKMDDGKEHRMSHLGRVSIKTPQMIMINFSDNPAAIKNAKLALQKSLLNINPQHEGVVLYVPTPRMTRERREQLANDAKGKMLNEYKQALNEIYTRFDKKSSRDSKTPDEEKHTRASLLELKRGMEARGLQIIEIKRKELLKEVA